MHSEADCPEVLEILRASGVFEIVSADQASKVIGLHPQKMGAACGNPLLLTWATNNADVTHGHTSHRSYRHHSFRRYRWPMIRSAVVFRWGGNNEGDLDTLRSLGTLRDMRVKAGADSILRAGVWKLAAAAW
jgi:hypothetical protein